MMFKVMNEDVQKLHAQLHLHLCRSTQAQT